MQNCAGLQPFSVPQRESNKSRTRNVESERKGHNSTTGKCISACACVHTTRAGPHLVNVVIHPFAAFRAAPSAINPNAVIMIEPQHTTAAFLKAGIGGSAVRQGAEDGGCALVLRRGFGAVAVARRSLWSHVAGIVLLFSLGSRGALKLGCCVAVHSTVNWIQS